MICFRCLTPSKLYVPPRNGFEQVQDFLEIPIAVENVSSYAEFHESQMTEWEFLNEVVHAADCGILLDVNNIYVSSQNHGFDPLQYVNNVDVDRVAQIHIAGHSRFEKYTLDTHDHPVLDPVWKLYARAIERTGPTATLLEWDDNIPSFAEVHAEALKANRYLAQPGQLEPEALAQPALNASTRCPHEPPGTSTTHVAGRDASPDPRLFDADTPSRDCPRPRSQPVI